MDRFSRFRRHKKTAAAAAAEAAAGGGDAATTDSATAAAPSRPKTSAGLPATTTTGSPETPALPEPSEESRPMTSSSHTPSTSSSFLSVNGTPSTASSLDPNAQQPQQQAMRGPLRSSRSPFRNLLRSSTKRARGSPSPATAPTAPPALLASPTTGLTNQMQNITLPSPPNGNAVSPLRLSGAKPVPPKEKRLSAQSGFSLNKPAMPSFLDLSPQEIEHKFQDITWLERNRMQNSIVAPNGRWTRVSGPHLRLLDRYNNIQPWEKNRVRLKVFPGQVDYINASPIVLTTTAPAHAARPPDRYIAMQGPKQNSVDHVWRMVYEQMRSPAVIVMLTETHEANQEKCFPYFPRNPEDPPIMINEYDEFSDGFHASVHCEAIEETPYGDAIELRKIVMRVHKKASPVMLAKRPSNASSNTDASSKTKDSTTNGANGSAKKSRLPSPIGKASGRKKGGKDKDLKDGKDTDGDSVMSEASAGSAPSPAPATATATASVPSLTETDEAGRSKSIDLDVYEDERVVYHFLFKRWPDFGVPALEDVDSFLGLMQLSAEKNADADNPRIVHCSAGVGRSGTFIALEHLLRELDAGVLENYDGDKKAPGAGEAEDEVMEGADDQNPRGRPPMPPLQQRDSTSSVPSGANTPGIDRTSIGSGILSSESDDLIYTTVNQLREQRRTMVQAESQYHFIYQVLRKLWKQKYGIAESDDGQGPRQSEDSEGGGAAFDEEGSSDGSEPAAKRLEFDPATIKA
ncbi:hypothetical protein SBRCBS47491_009528 [Sporothrix bragantina]|uniref:Protein-tyrosine phosphatase n=1 Tax=Sporothrix bragantina TaxID=671064 RepID=A0ABP0CYM6_9PEZI